MKNKPTGRPFLREFGEGISGLADEDTVFVPGAVAAGGELGELVAAGGLAPNALLATFRANSANFGSLRSGARSGSVWKCCGSLKPSATASSSAPIACGSRPDCASMQARL